MDDFTTEDIISYINLCMTLSDEEKGALKLRVMDELDLNGNKLSPEFSEELAHVFETELNYLEQEFLPAQDELIHTHEEEYNEELEQIRPELDELVEEYERNTKEVQAEYDAEFVKLDKAFDSVAQKETGKHEAAEIASIKEKLSQKPSND